jgi:hypothetical protein
MEIRRYRMLRAEIFLPAPLRGDSDVLDKIQSVANLTGQIPSSRIIYLNGHMIMKRNFEIHVTLLLMLILSLGGCAYNYGRLQPSSAVTAVFKADQVLPDHKYYYTGPDGWPDAIIAVNQDFTLVSDLWTAFEPSPKRLRDLMDYAQSHFGTNTHHFPYGYHILAPDGRKVGVWYSIWDWTTIEMRSDSTVVIYPPLTKELWPDGDNDDDHDDSEF